MNEQEAIDRLKGCTSAEEVQALASELGLELDASQLSAFGGKTGEMSDEELEGVAGGFFIVGNPVIDGIIEQIQALFAPKVAYAREDGVDQYGHHRL